MNEKERIKSMKNKVRKNRSQQYENISKNRNSRK